MFALPTAHAQTHGHPAKVIRLPDAPAFVAGRAVAVAPVSVTVDEAPPPAETVTFSEPEPVLVVEAESPRRRSRKIILTDGPYLPITGALPLRFAATRSWPAPIPAPEAGQEPKATTVAAEVPAAPPDKPAEPAEPKAMDPAKPQPAPASTVASEARMPNDLTADMVLGFLGDLPASDARVQGRFEPALPQGAASASGSISP